ncbi:PilZ domain-containing protein [Sphingomonas pruni]|uniref:PilZ domain-containing protein n=1 Tax=Sphingomonas pruni TaxID=40683 RepID=UPI000835600C|nr:PilZ domain-containing protein [Sphingomonas pruni]
MDQFSHDPLSDGTAADAAAQRNDARDSLLLVARFRIEGSAEIMQVRVRNLSSGGLMADVPKPIDIGTMVEVEVRGVGWVNGRIAWVAAGRAGVAFDHPIDPQAARKPVVASSGPTKDKPIKPLF